VKSRVSALLRPVFKSWLSMLTTAALATVVLTPYPARADQAQTTFNEAASALQKGAFSVALLGLERLSDQGFVHPDVSFNRAVAYLKRAASSQAKPGDLGQAVAALREASALRQDASADELIETVRLAISRNRAAKGRDPVVVSPTLGRTLSDALPLSGWAAFCVAASAALSLSLILRAGSKRSTWILGTNIASLTSLATLTVFGAMYALSYHYTTTTEEAVVIAEQASLRDKDGRPMLSKSSALSSADVPEGASVYVLARNSRLWKVKWGTAEGWLRDSDLRLLATR
jgi:hypothetical protein